VRRSKHCAVSSRLQLALREALGGLVLFSPDLFRVNAYLFLPFSVCGLAPTMPRYCGISLVQRRFSVAYYAWRMDV
jgi:hypothetical protein